MTQSNAGRSSGAGRRAEAGARRGRRRWIFTAALALAAAAAAGAAQGPARVDRERLRTCRGADGAVAPVTPAAGWARRRAEIVAAAESVMGPLPGAAKRVLLDVKVERETDCGSYVRREITYQAEPGARVPAYLLVPKEVLAGRAVRPGVLALMPTNGTEGNRPVVGLGSGTKPNRNYGEELAQRGFVVLAPPYPHLGDYKPDLDGLGYRSGTMKAIWDNVRGLDVLAATPGVSPRGFGAIGHSLGGHNSIYTAVFDERIKAVVSSCGFDSYLDYYREKQAAVWKAGQGWTQFRYMPRLADYAGRLEEIPFDFHELLGALAPRAMLAIAPKGDANFKWQSAGRVVAAARPVYALHGAAERLDVVHPDCEHDFPPEMRERAYGWLERWLGQAQ